MNTGIVDPEMKDDKWRLYLMKNEGADAGDYSLAAVGYKLDDGSNYFTGRIWKTRFSPTWIPN